MKEVNHGSVANHYQEQVQGSQTSRRYKQRYCYHGSGDSCANLRPAGRAYVEVTRGLLAFYDSLTGPAMSQRERINHELNDYIYKGKFRGDVFWA